MATQFVQQAQQQLGSAYDTQIQALRSQVPAVNQLYEALTAGLTREGQAGAQKIYEDTNSRGLLRSTIPTDLQTGLQQALLQKQGELGARQLQEIGGINTQLAGVGVDRANMIAQLANALRSQYYQEAQFGFDRDLALRQLGLQRQLGDREYQLRLQMARQGIG